MWKQTGENPIKDKSEKEGYAEQRLDLQQKFIFLTLQSYLVLVPQRFKKKMSLNVSQNGLKFKKPTYSQGLRVYSK